MESKHKNVLIGALLAVVFVMAVGYAAFAQTLTINGSAKITSNWHVGFDTTKTTETPGVVTATKGTNGTTDPSGTVSYDGDQNATIAANLIQPGDKVVFTLTIKNYGNIKAKLNQPVVTATSGEDSDSDALIVKQGNIIFTVTEPTPTTLDQDGTATMTVTAEFDSNAQSVGTTTSSSIKVTTLAEQAA